MTSSSRDINPHPLFICSSQRLVSTNWWLLHLLPSFENLCLHLWLRVFLSCFAPPWNLSECAPSLTLTKRRKMASEVNCLNYYTPLPNSLIYSLLLHSHCMWSLRWATTAVFFGKVFTTIAKVVYSSVLRLPWTGCIVFISSSYTHIFRKFPILFVLQIFS